MVFLFRTCNILLCSRSYYLLLLYGLTEFQKFQCHFINCLELASTWPQLSHTLPLLIFCVLWGLFPFKVRMFEIAGYCERYRSAPTPYFVVELCSINEADIKVTEKLWKCCSRTFLTHSPKLREGKIRLEAKSLQLVIAFVVYLWDCDLREIIVGSVEIVFEILCDRVCKFWTELLLTVTVPESKSYIFQHQFSVDQHLMFLLVRIYKQYTHMLHVLAYTQQQIMGIPKKTRLPHLQRHKDKHLTNPSLQFLCLLCTNMIAPYALF